MIRSLNNSRQSGILARLTAAAILLLAASTIASASVSATIAVSGSDQGTDASSITIAFNGFRETVNYDPTSTPNSIASAFAAMFSRDYLSQGLCAAASGNAISFKLKTGVFGGVTVGGSTASFQMLPSGFATGGGPAAATPMFSPGAGTYTSAQTVTISSATAGAAIYYTTNGTSPTTSSALYSGPVSVATSETFEAFAVAAGDSNSQVGTAAYVVNLPVTPTVVLSLGASSFPLSALPPASVQVSCNSACGQVDLRIDGSEWQTATLTANGSYATSAFPALTTGGHTLQAFYLGNSGYAAASSNVLSFTVTGGGGIPQATLSTHLLTFSATGVTMDLTLSNTGTAPLIISSIATGTPYFVATSTCGSNVAAGASCVISVVNRWSLSTSPVFTLIQSLTDQLTIASNDPGLTQGVALKAGNVPPAVSFSNVAFGATALGSSMAATVPVIVPYNTFTFCAASVTGADFTLSGPMEGGAGVGTNASYCSYTVTFTPSGTGVRTGSLVFATDGSYIPLTGLGVLSLSSTMTLSPTLIIQDFAGPGTSTLSNYGSTATNIQPVAVSAGFSQTNNCGTSLPAQSICTITVSSMQPAIPQGIQGLLTVTDDAGVQTTQLSGIIDPVLQFGPWVLGATSPYIEFYGAPLQANTSGVASGADPGDFPNNCTSPGSGQCYAYTRFAPAVAGPRSAMYRLSRQVNSPFGDAYLELGTGLASPGSGALLTFGPQTPADTPVGQPVTFAINANNTGTTAIGRSFSNPATVSINGSNASDFTVVANGIAPSCGYVQAAAQCQLSLSFTPSATGTRIANVVVTDSASGQSFTDALTGTAVSAAPAGSALTFPSTTNGAASAPESVTVTSIGDHAVFAYLALESASGGFNLTKASCAQGETPCLITIVFAPNVTGGITPPGETLSAILTLVDGATGSASSSQVIGTAVPPGAGTPSFAPSSLDFPLRAVGTTSVPKTVTLTNVGSQTLYSTGLALSGTNAGEFVLSNGCGNSLGTNASCTINISFAPAMPGSKSASIVLNYGSNQTATVPITGSAQ